MGYIDSFFPKENASDSPQLFHVSEDLSGQEMQCTFLKFESPKLPKSITAYFLALKSL